MKTTLKIVFPILLTVLISCGDHSEKKKPGFTYETKTPPQSNTSTETETVPPSKIIDLTNKGIGPISSVTLDDKIDTNLAKQGKALFKSTCSACHRPDKKFIGPTPKDILKRRTPEWVMNMILNPNNMVKDDPLAKALLLEYHGSPMPIQINSKEEARALLEYFRTL
ncbi:c-type cytochrome [Pseudotamlana carrageenivorans]|uniref:Cytochrome C n=1 Tax=Pseudotamlana carrageenivorans TaxID=2069432 RepID=A0A2I7SHN4_9FLAO|nr:cytochrome c [Tamlana carrageenivorans]AUS05406.1 cytochrome C [Tamlana carrageenivorans]